MDISIVSGTYNRLKWLKKMVNSVRRSIGNYYGPTFEFILVDGSSTDGTQEWCNEQDDITLIQHKELLGAVKAFNDGAYAANGEYVILANDDIQFLDDTIFLGWMYMQQHPDCGIGCFKQDRERQHLSSSDPNKYQVEVMPVIMDGKQASAPYGQVCIVPKWLGDKVGWWCNEDEYKIPKLMAKNVKPLHTYGGDNELSAQVYEAGYKVSPVPGTKVKDNEVDDDLRKRNNVANTKSPKALGVLPIGGHHPDSRSYGKKWLNQNETMVGPVVKAVPMLPNPIQTKERIIYLPLFEQGWDIQKIQKYGLREALSKVALVAEFDYLTRNSTVGKARMLGELETLCHNIKPTIILTQLHNGDVIGPEDITKLRANAPEAKFVNWNGDYWPEQLLNEKGLELSRAFDLQTVVNRDVIEKHQSLDISTKYWQIGYEPEGRGYEPEVYHDVVFLASGYGRKRQELGEQLRSLNDIELGIYGPSWPEGWSKGQSLYNFSEACKVYRGAKISVGDSQWPESGFVSNRVMQALAAGNSVLAHQWFRGMDDLGLIDGKTVIIWKDFNDLKRKIEYYLENENERKRIAIAGEQLALSRHSFDVRVQEIFAMLDIGQREQEQGDWRW